MNLQSLGTTTLPITLCVLMLIIIDPNHIIRGVLFTVKNRIYCLNLFEKLLIVCFIAVTLPITYFILFLFRWYWYLSKLLNNLKICCLSIHHSSKCFWKIQLFTELECPPGISGMCCSYFFTVANYFLTCSVVGIFQWPGDKSLYPELELWT